MGVVYAARDERLHRPVALKMISSQSYDETTRKRFWREARTAASVNHPNICQIYDIGDDDGDDLFIAMELLEGETLDRRLQKGPMSVSQAVPVALDILAALAAVHARGVVHRDLKPSNVFLTPHGVKVLDFGVARPQPEQALTAAANLTGTGVLVGTPRYIAPECVLGEAADASSDLFAVGAILFEILAGRPAFGGRTVPEVLRATVYEQPPALTGPPAVAAVDRVIRRALAKRPGDRPESADEMARQLRGIRIGDTGDVPAVAQVLTRLVVLPFRALRADPESDFLAFSLPDAIATSLSGTRSLIVRSSAVAARFAGEAPDLKALAAEADVDRVVTGTLLRSGEQVRAAVQLVEAPAGTLLASLTVQSSLGDLFRLQDDISKRVVQALSLPLVGLPTPTPDVPRDAQAYELYLRANELASSHEGLVRARDHVRAVPRAGSRLRTGMGAPWPLPSGDRQVHRRRGRQRVASRTRPRSRPRAEPSACRGPEVLRAPGGRHGASAAGPGSPADRSPSSRQRPRVVRGTRPRLSLLRALRGVRHRGCRGEAARPERPHERGRDAVDGW